MKRQLCCVLFTAVLSCVTAKSGYLMTAPKVFQPGSTEKICFTFFDVTEDVHVTITLDTTTPSVQLSSFENGIGKCVDLAVPSTSQQKAAFNVSGVTASGGYKFEDTTEVGLMIPDVLTFIQTDKPQYKPGQTVKFRVLSLDANLRPLTDTIHAIWIEDPTGVRMSQWLDIVTEKGLVSLDFATSEQPVLGEWTVVVQLQQEGGKTEKKPFKVEEYVLPKYEVVITSQSYVPINAETFSANICAKYTYGKPVKGTVSITACISETYRSAQRPCYEIVDQPINGCFKFTGKTADMELQSTRWSIWDAKLKITATVIEEATGVVLLATDESAKIERYLVKLDFKPHTPEYFKPSLPFSGKVLVTSPDGKPMPGELVRIATSRGTGFEEEIRSNERGEVVFTIPRTLSDDTTFTLDASVKGYNYSHSSDEYTPYQPRGYHYLKQWYSPSGSYLQIERKEESVTCGEEVAFEIVYTTELNTTFTFHYEVMSRGNIVEKGQKNYHFLEPEGARNQAQGPDSDQKNDTSSKPLEHVASMMLHVNIDHAMSPLAHLLVYYVREDGEVVADSVSVEVQRCLENDVSMKFSPDEVFPGAESSLLLQAAPESLCSVGIVDKSVHVLGGNNQLNIATIFSILSGFDLNEAGGTYGDDTYCEEYVKKRINETEPSPPVMSGLPAGPPGTNKKRKNKGKSEGRRVPRSSMPWWPGGYYSDQYDSIKAFRMSGVTVLSDQIIETRPCIKQEIMLRKAYSSVATGRSLGGSRGAPGPQAVPDAEDSDLVDSVMGVEKTVDIRTYFPETWLWELYEMGDESMLSIPKEVPHTITDWVGSAFCTNSEVGFGISETITLRAFQPFFLSYTLPYAIVRGETARVPVTVFNYLEECIVVEISMESTAQVSVTEDAQAICVCGSEAKSAYFSVTAQELGMVNLTAQASSVMNQDWLCENKLVKQLSQVRDAATREILVEPEGKLEEYTISNFVCPSDGPAEDVVSLELPAVGLVEGSAKATVSVIGDVMGPTLSNLDKLLQLPTGCGEQNMLKFAPNIFVMQYLKATNQQTDEIRTKAVGYMKTGYQRELTYRHDDGSYSAFGNSDPSGSTWLTAFVVRSFAQARQFIFIDKKDFDHSIEWFRGVQKENGCFKQVGKVLHKGMQGGLSEDSDQGLTAYVLIALIDAGLPNSDNMITDAISCLKSAESDDTYTSALITYAFSLLDGPYDAVKATMKDKMDAMATSKDGMKYWSQSASTVPPTEPPPFWTSHTVPANVEMTAYTLMAYMHMPSSANKAIGEGLPIVRWLSSQRNAYGGFSSTQDTVVALQALAGYAAMVYGDGVDIHVRTSDTYSTSIPEIHVTDSNSLVLHQQDVPVPNMISYTVTGTGCALIQSNVRYHRDPNEDTSSNPSFKVRVSVRDVKDEFPSDHCNKRKLNICTKYDSDEPSNMAVVEVKMQTGWIPDKLSLKQMLKDKLPGLKRQEIDHNKVFLYFDQLTNEYTCMNFLVEEDMEVSNPKEAFVHVYDYYDTDLSMTVNYKITRTCGTKEELPVLTPEEYDEKINSGFQGQIRQPLETPFIDVVEIDEPQCPQCFDSAPADLEEKICSAQYAYKGVVKSGKLRILSDQRNIHQGTLDKMVMIKQNHLGFSLKDCPCNILTVPLSNKKNLNTRVLLLTKVATLSGKRKEYKLPLGADSIVVPLGNEREIRQIIKRCGP